MAILFPDGQGRPFPKTPRRRVLKAMECRIGGGMNDGLRKKAPFLPLERKGRIGLGQIAFRNSRALKA
jgi:hypothetical protein